MDTENSSLQKNNANFNTQLIEAAENDHDVIVLNLVSEGANVNTVTDSLDTPLILATEKGHLKTVKALLQVQGIQINVANKKGYTALMTAARHGNTILLKLLLDSGAQLNGLTLNKSNILMIAAYYGHLPIVQSLSNFQNILPINAKNKFEETALMLAAVFGYAAVVKALLDVGAEVNTVDSEQDTALLIAVDRNQTETVQTLLQATGILIDTANKDGYTALMIAASRGYIDILKALLQAGAEINTEEQIFGGTALIYAAERGHTEAVQILLQEDGILINSAYKDGTTALMLAASNNHVAIVKALLDAGADANITDDVGKTLLQNTMEWLNFPSEAVESTDESLAEIQSKKEIVYFLLNTMPSKFIAQMRYKSRIDRIRKRPNPIIASYDLIITDIRQQLFNTISTFNTNTHPINQLGTIPPLLTIIMDYLKPAWYGKVDKEVMQTVKKKTKKYPKPVLMSAQGTGLINKLKSLTLSDPEKIKNKSTRKPSLLP
jgi:ankyrin repeat protein